MSNEDYRTIFKNHLLELKKIRSRLAIERKRPRKKTKQTTLVNSISIYLVCWNCGHKNFNSNILRGKNDSNQNVRLCNNCKSQIDYLG